MISTFQGLLVAVLAFLPCASYTFALERVAGSYGMSFSDRLVRFLAASAVFHAVFAGGEALLYRYLIAEHRLQNGTANLRLLQASRSGTSWCPPWWAASSAGGTRTARSGRYWSSERRPSPGLGTTCGGDRLSYASGYPEAGDLYLAMNLTIDATTGELARTDSGRMRDFSALALGDDYESAGTLDIKVHPYAALGNHDQTRAVWLESLELLTGPRPRSRCRPRMRQQLDTLGRA